MNLLLLKKKTLGLIFASCLSAGFSYGQALSGSYSVGTGGNYTTFTDAGGLFQAINTNGISGDVTVNVLSNISEPGTYPLNDFTSNGVNDYHLTIKPNAAVSDTISGPATDSIIFTLYQVRNLKIDGSFNGSGRYLTFVNPSTSKNASVIVFYGGCTKDTLANCVLEGANNAIGVTNNPAITTGAYGGVVVLNAFTTVTTGTPPIKSNSNIAILGNIIRNVPGTACGSLLRGLSYGGSSPDFIDNNSITVVGNHFVNAFALALQVGIFNTQPAPWTITNNYFYSTETNTHTQTKTLINLYQGLGHIFSNNIIGGSDSTGGGAPMSFMPGTSVINFIGTTSSATSSLVQTPVIISNNKIGNISIVSGAGGIGGATNACVGINAFSRVNVNNNIIGGSNTPIITNGYAFHGIATNTASDTVSNNTIKNITSTFPGVSTTARSVCGISVTGNKIIVTSNIIDSIMGSTSSNAGVSAPSGIYVANLNTAVGNLTANNSITNIINSDNTALTAPGATVVGINIASTPTFPGKYVGNYIANIYGLNNNASGTIGNNVAGILESSATSASGNDTFINNVISLGANITPKSWVKGIHVASGTANANFVFINNTVQISPLLSLNAATIDATGKSGATCFSRNTANQNIYLYNNIFSNQATNSNNGIMSALSLYALTAATPQYYGDYNVLYAPNSSNLMYANQSSVGTSYSLSGWRTLIAKDSNTTNALVSFTSNTDLHINATQPEAWNVFGRGISNANVPADKDNNTRSTTAGIPVTVGAYEIAMPSSTPANMTIVNGTPTVGTPTELWSNGRKIAEINWTTITSPPASLTAKFYPGQSAPGLGYANSVKANFQISQTDFTGSYTIKQYVNAAENAGVAYSNMKGYKLHDGDVTYTMIAGTGSNSSDANGNYLQSTLQTTFSTFGLSEGITPLAIDLKSITAENKADINIVNWIAAKDENKDIYELEASTNSKDFKVIAKVTATGKGGNYTYTHTNPANGFNYYRLHLINTDGNNYYSTIVKAFVATNDNWKVTVYPNPLTDKLNIVSSRADDSYMLQIFDITGKEVYQSSIKDANTSVNISKLNAGNYIVKISSNDVTKTFKVTKN